MAQVLAQADLDLSIQAADPGQAPRVRAQVRTGVRGRGLLVVGEKKRNRVLRDSPLLRALVKVITKRRRSRSSSRHSSPGAGEGPAEHPDMNELSNLYLRAAYVCDESAFAVLSRLGDEGNQVVRSMLDKKFLFVLGQVSPERHDQGWQKWDSAGYASKSEGMLRSVVRRKLDPHCNSVEPMIWSYLEACRMPSGNVATCLYHTVFVTADWSFYSRYLADTGVFRKLVEVARHRHAHSRCVQPKPVHAAWYVSHDEQPDPKQQIFLAKVYPELGRSDIMPRPGESFRQWTEVSLYPVFVCDILAYNRLSKFATREDGTLGVFVRRYMRLGCMWICAKLPPEKLQEGWRLFTVRGGDHDVVKESDSVTAFRNACRPCLTCQIPLQNVVFTTGDPELLNRLGGLPFEGPRVRLAWDVSTGDGADVFTLLEDPTSALPPLPPASALRSARTLAAPEGVQHKYGSSSNWLQGGSK